MWVGYKLTEEQRACIAELDDDDFHTIMHLANIDRADRERNSTPPSTTPAPGCAIWAASRAMSPGRHLVDRRTFI